MAGRNEIGDLWGGGAPGRGGVVWKHGPGATAAMAVMRQERAGIRCQLVLAASRPILIPSERTVLLRALAQFSLYVREGGLKRHSFLRSSSGLQDCHGCRCDRYRWQQMLSIASLNAGGNSKAKGHSNH